MQNLANHLVHLLQVCIHFEYNAHVKIQSATDRYAKVPALQFFFLCHYFGFVMILIMQTQWCCQALQEHSVVP